MMHLHNSVGLEQLSLSSLFEVFFDSHEIPVLHEMPGHVDNGFPNNLYNLTNSIRIAISCQGIR
jgi:hypothetical protein